MTETQPNHIEQTTKRRPGSLLRQMPRGRGRGRNPSLPRSTSRRGHQPNPRRGDSPSRANGSLRRSARLAGNSNLDESMADVARRTQTAVRSRAVDADFPRDRSRPRQRRARTNDNIESRGLPNQRYREPVAHHFSSNGEPRYTMDVIVQPPPTARLGTALQPPVTVRLRGLDGDATDDAGTTNLLAVATLTSDSLNDSTDPVDLTALLAGRVADSVHPFSEQDSNCYITSPPSDQGVGYVSFPDLAICGEGTWRIRVTLIRIRTSAGESPVSMRGGSSVQVVDSNPITVERGSGHGRESGKHMRAAY